MYYIQETNTQKHPTQMSESAYKEARVCIPFVCTDAVIADMSTKILYLAWRKATPARGWWMIGGGVKNGQSPTEAMRMNFARETSLLLSPDRFEIIADAVNFTQWTIDAHISNVHIPFLITLSDDERALVQNGLERHEYTPEQGLQAFTLEAIEQSIVEGSGYPQTILYYDTLFHTNHFPRVYKNWQEIRQRLPAPSPKEVD